MGYLRPFEVINKLKNDYNIEIKSTQALNKILVEMNIIQKDFNIWRFTEKGKIYNPFRSDSDRISGLMPDIVPLIAKYLKEKNG